MKTNSSLSCQQRNAKCLVNLKKLDLEDQGGIGRNATREWRWTRLHATDTSSAVGVVGGESELGLLAQGHGHHTLIPTYR